MENRLVEHRIAVGNIIYGHADFMTLHIPETWDIAPGVGRPEVVAAHERNGQRWVVTGKAWYVLYHRELGWAMELLLESRVQRKTRPAKTGEMAVIQGHLANVRRWQRSRGLFQRKMITYIELMSNCDQSDRTLRIELSGRCPAEGFDQILGVISHWQCH